jgi:cytochrome P450
MDFARLAQYFTLDVLSKIAFGSAFGYLEANEDLYDYNKTSTEFLPILEMITNHPSIRSIMTSRLVQALAAPKGTDKIGQGRILGIARAAVAERYGPDAKVKRDMLGSFVSRGLTQQEAESESHLQIMAGSDSTSTVMRVTFMYIVANPVSYSKLLAEIEAAIDRGAVSHPVIKHAEALQLPYLQACIWEGLRICPPLFGLQSKMAPTQGETVNGTFFPGGTEIATCPSMVTRRKDIFGNDADIFRPERWIEADASTRAKYERTTDVIFGSGRFVCLGRNIAWMELNKAFVEVCAHFPVPCPS